MIGGYRDESWLLEKPSQCSVVLPRTIGFPANCIYGYVVKRSQTCIRLANLTLSSFQRSWFLGHPFKSNLDRTDKLEDGIPRSVSNIFLFFYLCIFVQGRYQPTQSQLIQIYSVAWTDVYDTYNIEHRTEPISH